MEEMQYKAAHEVLETKQVKLGIKETQETHHPETIFFLKEDQACQFTWICHRNQFHDHVCSRNHVCVQQQGHEVRNNYFHNKSNREVFNAKFCVRTLTK